MNRDEQIAASDTNYFESWRSMAEPNGFLHEEDGILIAAPSPTLPWVNVVFVMKPLREPQAQLARAFALLDERKQPFFVHMREGMDPASERGCEQLGFVSENPVPGMVLDPIVERPNETALGIRKATDDATLADFVSVSAESFGIPIEEARTTFPTYGRPNVHYWIGYCEGKPVACSNMLVLGDIASINIIGTLEADRGRGFGAAITQAAVNGGADAGCKVAVLQASELGQPVYARMGFKTVATYKTYLRP